MNMYISIFIINTYIEIYSADEYVDTRKKHCRTSIMYT